MANKRHLLNSGALGAYFILGFGLGAAHSADVSDGGTLAIDFTGTLPAVSQINAKIEASWGAAEPGYNSFIPFIINNGSDHAGKIKGAVTIPLSHQFGLQLDGVAGQIQSEQYYHAAGHLFWRDPAIGLLGVYGSTTTWNSVDANRIGVEGELYLNQFTLSGVVGNEWGDVDRGMFSIADASIYTGENLKFTVGHRYAEEVGHAFAGGFEYQFYSTQNVGYSVFVDGRTGDNDYQSIFAGIKLYFGADKSLIRRHREDDPGFRDEDQSVISCSDGAVVSDGILLDSEFPLNRPCNVPQFPFKLPLPQTE